MTSCLASSNNMGSSKNLLMETSSERPFLRRVLIMNSRARAVAGWASSGRMVMDLSRGSPGTIWNKVDRGWDIGIVAIRFFSAKFVKPYRVNSNWMNIRVKQSTETSKETTHLTVYFYHYWTYGGKIWYGVHGLVLTNLRSSWNFWLYGFSVVAENTAVTATKMENWPLVFKMWESN